jgi:CheY-like chemotaxis protein
MAAAKVCSDELEKSGGPTGPANSPAGSETTGGAAFRTNRESKALILVVDDDPNLLLLMKEALSSRLYRVATAKDGVEALERLEEELPQLILLDMRMPVMDGWTFTKVLRERHGRSIPVVVITAAEDSTLRADEVGADADLGKPFDLQQLYDVVDDALVDGAS